MNLTHPSEVKELLARLDFRPSKVLGQNFLIDVNILKIILSTAYLHQSDTVLEIGPGLGVLTEWLGRWAGKVIAVEKDQRLFRHLQERFANEPNIELIHGDALEVDLDALLAGGANKVVSNLPYSVGSRLLVNFIQSAHAPEKIVVTVQKEVAQRLAADTGRKDYGLISVLAQTRYQTSIRKTVSPTCFYPPPEVHSAIVEMTLLDEQPEVDMHKLTSIVKTCFSARRKQLATILHRPPFSLEANTAHELMLETGIELNARPENVTPQQWVHISGNL